MLHKIYDYLKEKAPLETCESWDNSGMLVEASQPVKKVLLTMDITSAVVDEAIAGGYELIVAHHPVIFRGVKRLGYHDVVFRLIQNNISAICMHTNLDAAQGGVNDVLAGKLGLVDVEPFVEIGRMGKLEKEMTVAELANHLAKELDTTVKCSLPDKKVKKVALIGGSAGEYWQPAKECGADVFVTGEASHHHTLDAREEDIAILVGGHWNTERPVIYALKEELDDNFADIRFNVSVADADPFTYMK